GAAVAREAWRTCAGVGRDGAAGGDLPDAAVAEVRDVEVTGGIEGHAAWAELRGGRGAAVAPEAVPTVAGVGRDGAPGGDLADAAVAQVRDVEIAGGIERHAVGPVELRGGGGAAGARGALRTGAGVGRDGATGGDLADAVVLRVRDVEVAGGIEGHAAWADELRGGRGAAVAREALRTGAGVGRDDAAGGDLPDAVVLTLRDVEVAGGIEGHADGFVELRGGRGAAVACETHRTCAGVGRDGAVGGDLADAVVAAVCDVEVAGGIEGHANGCVELRGGRGAAGAREAPSRAAWGRWTAAGVGRDGAAGADLADAVVGGVREVEA